MLSIPLVLLAACGGATFSSATGGSTPVAASSTGTVVGTTTVQVTLSNFKVHSSLTTFKVGTDYRFVVTNTGQATHELMAGPISAAHASEEVRDKARLFEVSDVAPGQTQSQDYIFTHPAPVGTLEFACHEPGHYEMVMHQNFTVTP
jgi:uncharacterized cupredoxin-like copper-binding protein